MARVTLGDAAVATTAPTGSNKTVLYALSVLFIVGGFLVFGKHAMEPNKRKAKKRRKRNR